MPPSQQPENTPRGAEPQPPTARVSAKEAIIATAERLWGAQGINGASLREITIAAGSANNSSIGYHFGDKHGLIDAIFRARLPALEQRRQILIDAAKAEGKFDDPQTLLRMIFKPVFDEVDQHGRHSFAAFLRAVNRFPQWDYKAGTEELAPTAFLILNILREKASSLPQSLFDIRYRLINEICCGAITVQEEYQPDTGADPILATKIFEDALSASAHLLLRDG
ncbi:TetR/AcrR family transcriptional regulator [Rhizorhabdus argentea]|uniref:TetR/AcrR family transcriptional regulator n=1 Tax=Rhizorhabdus argentea TaxID=1387174 RepID=UPI0030EE15B8